MMALSYRTPPENFQHGYSIQVWPGLIGRSLEYNRHIRYDPERIPGHSPRPRAFRFKSEILIPRLEGIGIGIGLGALVLPASRAFPIETDPLRQIIGDTLEILSQIPITIEDKVEYLILDNEVLVYLPIEIGINPRFVTRYTTNFVSITFPLGSNFRIKVYQLDSFLTELRNPMEIGMDIMTAFYKEPRVEL